MSLIAYVNGTFLPLQSATIHIEDRGFQFADGVYEVIACHGKQFLELSAHLNRLHRSCAAIQIPLPVPLDQLEALVRETYQRNALDDAMIYIQITRGIAARQHVTQETLIPTLIVTVRALHLPDDDTVKRGVNAMTLPDIRWKRCDIKSIALLASVVGKQAAFAQGAQEAFWLDTQGHVLEGCATNVFAIIDGTLITHPQGKQILGGITRDLALNLAEKNKIPVCQRPWKLDEPKLSECMMSSTTNALMPVVRVDNTRIGDGTPGPITQKLRTMLIKNIANICQP